ncbi:MAG: response regulator [Candidatus Doudnabacteria bacterium]|nr:response regulator [Candidatus Doudnabacteria bacterium]
METQIKKQKLLLVDDNELTRIYFREIFWLHGLEFKFDLEMAESLEQAAQMLETPATRPDIVFLGLVMSIKIGKHNITTPEAGFNLLRHIKTTPGLKQIKVFIFSAFDNEEYKKTAKELGADAYLVKGQNLPGDLIDFVQKNLNQGNAI